MRRAEADTLIAVVRSAEERLAHEDVCQHHRGKGSPCNEWVALEIDVQESLDHLARELCREDEGVVQ